MGGAAALGAASLLLAAPDLTCGPCPDSGVPFFDRWAVGPGSVSLDHVSTVALGAFSAAVALDLYRRDDLGLAHAAAAFEAATLAAGVAFNLKQLTGRKRPYAFSDEAANLTLSERENGTRSFPSAHASVAAAVGMSYLLSRGGASSTETRAIVIAAGVAIGLARVASHHHFPSDVLAGAALGAASALFVHQVRF